MSHQSMSSLPEGGRHRKAQASPLPRKVRGQTGDPRGFQKVGAKEWKWQRGIVTHPPSESKWTRGHFSMKKWESEKHKNWSMPPEGVKGHVAIDGSLLGTTGK